jgi:hypothetical protein
VPLVPSWSNLLSRSDVRDVKVVNIVDVVVVVVVSCKTVSG